MKTTTIEQNQHQVASRIGCIITGFFYAAAAYPVSATIVAFLIDSGGTTDLTRLPILLQFIVGLLFSMIAYNAVSNRSIRFGMRICYGLVAGSLFIIGAYTILVSLMNI